MNGIPWADEPANKHYLAAYDLLALIWDAARAETAVALLRAAPVTELPASNVAWAASFDPLPLHDPGVQHELTKVLAGKPRPPVLCVRRKDTGIIIADGHHRVSLAYGCDPFAPIRLKLA